jgi:hypothetical protein
LLSDRFHIVMRGRLFNIIVLNSHSSTKDKSDDSMDNIYEQLELVHDHFPEYHTKLMLGEFKAQLGRHSISNRQLGKTVYIRIVFIMVLEQ